MEIQVRVPAYIIILCSCTFVLTKAINCNGLNCLNNSCVEDVGCLSDCEKGFTKDRDGKCVKLCPENCKVCENGTCTGCKKDFFGLHCEKSCSGCIDGLCDQENGHCDKGCEHRFDHSPWCNESHEAYDHHKDEHHLDDHHEKAKVTKAKAEEHTRQIYVWIAGAVIGAVIIAIVVIIVYVRCHGATGDTKDDFDIERTGKESSPTLLETKEQTNGIEEIE